MRLLDFTNDGYYHVYSRGADKRDIFLEIADYERFLTNLIRSKHSLVNRRHEVSIVAYALMPNHFHLVLRQKEEGGVSTFMGRLGNGYAKYFNIRNDRTGHLFESNFKAKLVDDEIYLHTLIQYVHQNPKELFASLGINACEKEFALYPWSSLRHYQGFIHDPVVDEGEIAEIFGCSQPLVLVNPQG